MDQAKYEKIVGLIKAIGRGEDNKERKLFNELKAELAGFPPADINDVPKAEKKGSKTQTLQEVAADCFTDQVHQKEVSAELLDVMKELLAHNANPDVKNENGQSMLHQILWKPLGDKESKDYTDKRKRTIAMLDLLYEYKADFSAKDERSNTLAHVAITTGNTGLLETLHFKGTGLNIYNKDNKTPLDVVNEKLTFSKQDKLLELQDALEKWGAKTWREVGSGLAYSGRVGRGFRIEKGDSVDDLRAQIARARDGGYIHELFNNDETRTLIQSRLPYKEVRECLPEVDALNKKVIAQQAEAQRQKDAEEEAALQAEQKAQAATPAKQRFFKIPMDTSRETQALIAFADKYPTDKIQEVINVIKLPLVNKKTGAEKFEKAMLAAFPDKNDFRNAEFWKQFEKLVELQLNTASAKKNLGILAAGFKEPYLKAGPRPEGR